MDAVHEGGSEYLSASVHIDNIDREEASPDESENESRSDRLKTSDKVGTAGKGNAKAETWKAPRKSDRKDLIESETPKGSARRKARE
ncbi:hypothetical protein ACIHCX_22390, partial [Streptomyces sp. NPDC052043]|uniref:hypothetical protein n=1 Tax=Streptomyces sp. NPDC052043 TaxID=3365684 RepID=UPI0037D96BA8